MIKMDFLNDLIAWYRLKGLAWKRPKIIGNTDLFSMDEIIIHKALKHFFDTLCHDAFQFRSHFF